MRDSIPGHVTGEEALGCGEGVKDEKIDFSDKTHEHRFIPVGVRGISLKTRNYPNPGVEISHSKYHEASPPKLNSLLGDQVEEAFIPLNKTIRGETLASNVAMQEGTFAAILTVQDQPLSLILHILQLRRN